MSVLKSFVSVLCLAALLGSALPSVARTQEAPQPSKEHEFLKSLVGVWDAEIDFYPSGPSGPKMTSKGMETNKMLGGFILLTDFEGDIGGAPFSGHGQNGYDPTEKKYVGTWCDSMGPSIMNLKGNFDAKSHTMTMEYEATDPSSGQKTSGKNMEKRIDDNTRVFEMFGTLPGGKEMVKMMEVRYKRQAAK